MNPAAVKEDKERTLIPQEGVNEIEKVCTQH